VRRQQARTITAGITADIIPIHRAIEIVAFRSRLTDEISSWGQLSAPLRAASVEINLEVSVINQGGRL
jgi:hypothetical protein